MIRQQPAVYSCAPQGVSLPETSYYTASSVNSLMAHSLTNGSSPDNTSSISEQSIVAKEELSSISWHICRQLRTIVGLVDDFTRDVCEENESDADLLHELQNKVRPFLVNLDEEMSACERLIRLNIDNARISEDRVAWLLKFNKYQLEMRRMLSELSGAVYDDLERVLTLRHRGCLGVHPKKDTVDNLHQMKLGMDRAEKLIDHERVNV